MYRQILLLVVSTSGVSASADAVSAALKLDLSTATVGGTLLLPRANRPLPCVVIVGGTLSQLRDGELLRKPGIPQRRSRRLEKALRTPSARLCRSGDPRSVGFGTREFQPRVIGASARMQFRNCRFG